MVGRKGWPRGRPRKKGVGVVGGSPDGARLLSTAGGPSSPNLVVRCEREVTQREQADIGGIVSGLGGSPQCAVGNAIQVELGEEIDESVLDEGTCFHGELVDCPLKQNLACDSCSVGMRKVIWAEECETIGKSEMGGCSQGSVGGQRIDAYRTALTQGAEGSSEGCDQAVESLVSHGGVDSLIDQGGVMVAVEPAKSVKLVDTTPAGRDAQGWQVAKGKAGPSKVIEAAAIVVAESRFSPLAEESRGSVGDCGLLEGLGGVIIPGVGAIT
ncbi:hypothetical protein Dimus_032257 [Dionaea muscipula]